MEIRLAKRGDESAIMGLIMELAEYEKEPQEVANITAPHHEVIHTFHLAT